MRMMRWTAAVLVCALVAVGCAQRTPGELAEDYPIDLEDANGGDSDDPDSNPDEGSDPGGAPDPDNTPLGLDPEVRTGTLNNGLTYYLRSNDAPGGAIDLRLVVNAGSSQQDVPDSGGAHFLEHMLFNGTELFPGNQLDLALQRLGIQFGPELNAFTSYDETVYILSATTTDPAAVSTAFDVLAEWASAAIIDPDEVIAERGVVRDELRQGRESVDGIIFDEFERIYTDGTPYEGFAVIGEPDKVESTVSGPLREFYDRWYRPDNMAVVVVGDMPIDRMESMLIERFDGLTPRGADHPERNEVEIAPVPEPTAEIVSHPDNVVDNLSIDIPAMVWDTGTVGGAELVVWEALIADMVSTRLSDAWFSGDLALDQQPWLGEFAINRELRYFGSNLQGPDLALALEQYLGVLRGAADGFTAEEVEGATATYGSGLDARENSIGSIQDAEYASIYANHFLAGTTAEAPLDSIQRERRILSEVDPEQLANHWAWMLETGGPIVVAVGADEATLPSVDTMLEIVEQTVATSRSDSGHVIEELMAPPPPVEPDRTDSRTTANGTVSIWEFANGATVVFQPTTIEEGGVTLLAEGLGGYSGLPEGTAALAGLATDAVSQSGVADIDPGELDRFLADKSVSLFPYIAAETEGFSGSSTSDDVEILFQLLNLLITAPRVDDTGFGSAIASGEVLLQQVESDASTAAALALTELIYQGEFHSWIPSRSQLDSTTPTGLLDLYTERLGTVDDLIISVVGDISPDVIEDAARTYVGSLPPGADDTFVDTRPGMIDGIAAREVALPEGTANGGIEMLWSIEREWTASAAIVAVVLETIINTRIIETVREDLGASYGGFASIVPLTIPDTRMEAYIAIDGDPSRLGEIREAVLGELAQLSTKGPSKDELERAVSVIYSDYEFVDNWLFIVENLELERDPDARIITTDHRFDLLETVDTEGVRSLAAALFDPGTYIEVTRTNG